MGRKLEVTITVKFEVGTPEGFGGPKTGVWWEDETVEERMIRFLDEGTALTLNQAVDRKWISDEFVLDMQVKTIRKVLRKGERSRKDLEAEWDKELENGNQD